MLKVFRGELLHFLADPAKVPLQDSYQYIEDGLLVIEDGLVAKIGDFAELFPTLAADIEITHYEKGLIVPGFIDTHVHYPQTEFGS